MIAAYVSSPSNKLLLSQYALKKLKIQWPACKTLKDLIELHLQTVLEALFDNTRYDSWQVTAMNVAEMNTIVWTKLEAAVKASLEGQEINTEKAIDEMLVAKMRVERPDERESVTLERTPCVVSDVHDKLWKS